MGKGRRAGITLAIPWDERFRGARVTLPRGWRRGIWGGGGSLVGLFTPRLAARRSQRNRWQRATSLPDEDDVRLMHAFSFEEESLSVLEGVEPPERIITKRYLMLEQVCFSISWEFAISVETTEIKTSIPYLCRYLNKAKRSDGRRLERREI